MKTTTGTVVGCQSGAGDPGHSSVSSSGSRSLTWNRECGSDLASWFLDLPAVAYFLTQPDSTQILSTQLFRYRVRFGGIQVDFICAGAERRGPPVPHRLPFCSSLYY